ncbi:MAG: hypothetical protein K8S99_05495 [Planctomycetes bacterium]|nr:hypothetical protein [Planctomycetota bacterium]
MDATSSRTVAPNHWDLYLIIAGVVLGVLLGPAVLGRVAPETYDNWFVGVGSYQEELDRLNTGLRDELKGIEASGATEVAVTEKVKANQGRLIELQNRLQQAQLDHTLWMRGRSTALILAALVLMVIESMLDAGSAMRGRLVSGRYAVTAMWLALLLAQPSQLKSLPLLFIGLLVVVVLAVSSLPMGRRAA